MINRRIFSEIKESLRYFPVVSIIRLRQVGKTTLTKGNYVALKDLNAPVNYVITPSSDDYFFKERIRICSLRAFISKYLPNL